jgi:hypothetical protein
MDRPKRHPDSAWWKQESFWLLAISTNCLLVLLPFGDLSERGLYLISIVGVIFWLLCLERFIRDMAGW